MTEEKRLSQAALDALTSTAVEQYRLLGMDGDESAGSMRAGLAALVEAGAADEAALAAFEAAVAAEHRDTELDAPLPERALEDVGEAAQRELVGTLLNACGGDQRASAAAGYLIDYWDLTAELQAPVPAGA